MLKKSTLLLAFAISVFALEIPKNHIVSTSWLSKNIDDKNLVVIDTRSTKAYKKSHIKGAVNYPKKVWFRGKLGNIPKLQNSMQQVQDMLQNAGVTEKSLILFYSAGTKNKDFADAVSGIWNLWLYGVQNSVLLNGGFAKWVSEKKSVTVKLPKIAKSDIELDSFDKSIVASLYDINEAMYDDNIQITDARVSKFYTGIDKKKSLLRHGRIPTAKLTPVIRYTKKTGSYFELISANEAKKTLYNSGYGVEIDKPLITYCNTGHKARGLWFIAKFLVGMKNVKVFDGSMVEYSRTNLPIETGEPME